MMNIWNLLKGEKGSLFWGIILIGVGIFLYFLSGISPLSFHRQIKSVCSEIQKIRPIKDEEIFREKLDRVISEGVSDFQHLGPISDFVKHLSIAIVIAGILIITIEWHTKKRFQREAGEDVLHAVLRKLIPEAVFLEIKEHILQKAYYRKNWHYHFVFKGRPYEDLREGTIVYEYTVSWEIENISSEPIKYTPASIIFNHLKASVHDANGKEIWLTRTLEICKDGSHLLSGEEIEKQEKAQRGKDLISIETKPFILEPRKKVRIETKKEEIAYHPSTEIWSMAGFGENLKVTIENQVPQLISDDIKVYLLHPRGHKLTKDRIRPEWVYEGGLLPNQCIRLSWDYPPKAG